MTQPATGSMDVQSPASRSNLSWRFGVLILVGWAIGMVLFGAPLVFTRHFHVDELQAAYNAALWGLHRLPELSNYAAPFLVPMAALVAGGGPSWTLLVELRLLFFGLFALNLALTAFAARVGGRLAGRAAALIGISLVEPFWRHGFEIRHDGVLLATCLGLFVLGLRAANGVAGRWTFFLAGALAASAQANSFKAFLYWPAGLALMLLWARASGGGLSWRRACLALAAGGLAGAAVNLGLLAISGHVGVYLELYGWLATRATAGPARFAGTLRLLELLVRLPLLTIPAVWALVRLPAKCRHAGDRWIGVAATVAPAWLGLEVLAVQLNPAPYAYNFVHVMPFLFLLAVDGWMDVLSRLQGGRSVAVVAVLVSLAVTFATDVRRDPMVALAGDFQKSYMEAAEALTSSRDPVLDGVGLVLSRRPPGEDWMMHSLFIQAYRDGARSSYRELLTREPAPVLMTNYRWNWLDREDREFVRSRYLEIWPRLLVLGQRVDPAATEVEIVRPGRYALSVLGTETVELGGTTRRSGSVLDLEAGIHAVRTGGFEARLAWLGPESWSFPPVLALPPHGDLFLSD